MKEFMARIRNGFFLFLFVLPFSFFSCEKDDPLIIGVAVPNLEADFFVQISNSVVDLADKDGARVLVVEAGNDGVKQVNQIQNLIKKDMDALIYIPAGASAASVPVKLCRNKGIPVICVDRFPLDFRGDTFIASNSISSVYNLGMWVIEQTGGIADVAIIHGQLGTTPEVDRSKGWAMAMAEAPGMKVVAEQSADWYEHKAYEIAKKMLNEHPSITVIFAQSDSMALGASKAIRESGSNHKIWCVGFDGDVHALKELKKGVFDATCTQQTQYMGQLAYKSVIDILSGKELPVEIKLNALVTTQQNVDRYIESHP